MENPLTALPTIRLQYAKFIHCLTYMSHIARMYCTWVTGKMEVIVWRHSYSVMIIIIIIYIYIVRNTTPTVSHFLTAPTLSLRDHAHSHSVPTLPHHAYTPTPRLHSHTAQYCKLKTWLENFVTKLCRQTSPAVAFPAPLHCKECSGQLGNAEVLQCCSDEVLQCCCAEVLQCWGVAVLQYCCATVLSVAMLQYWSIAVLRCCSAVVLRCCSAAVLRCCSAAVLRCCSAAVLRCCSAEVL